MPRLRRSKAQRVGLWEAGLATGSVTPNPTETQG